MTPEDKYNIPEHIWVDRETKVCDKKKAGARRATYYKEYELYVIDH